MFAESQRYGQASMALRNLAGHAYVVEIIELIVFFKNTFFRRLRTICLRQALSPNVRAN